MSIEIQTLKIPDVKIIKPKKFGDHRGFFSEVYNKSRLKAYDIKIDFIQDNHSLSVEQGTLRGLHFQTPPFAQDKLVRVVRGSIYDVAVDIRRSSPTFGEYVAATLTATDWNQILVTKGFAHGFITLEPNTEVIYKVSADYSPINDKGIAWNDPSIGIDWPFEESKIILSEKDEKHPLLNEIITPFE